MNRATYYNYIEERLTSFCSRVESRGKSNILDYHVLSENFYRDLFNKLYKWNLENMNSRIQNVEAIDLIDESNKIIIQVSATNTKKKIDNALSKPSLSLPKYEGFNFKFISIAKGADNLRSRSYNPPTGITFDPAKDIFDAESILKAILDLDSDTLEAIYYLIKSELGRDTDVLRLESNLSHVINVLSKENLTSIDSSVNINIFEIERKIDFNSLNTSKDTIDDYKLRHHIVDRIYSEFDKSGYNKSISVLNAIRKEYAENSSELTGDKLFNLVISNISERILQSSNLEKISQEEMEMCVSILAVDAFIRCKIFKNPNDYNYATS